MKYFLTRKIQKVISPRLEPNPLGLKIVDGRAIKTKKLEYVPGR